VALSITLVGTTDRQLEELLAAPGHRVKTVALSDLLALSQPGAAQPDVVVLDVRASSALPPTLASLRRQHPATGVVIVARRMDPALMLEAMRAGVNEWLADPITAQDLAHAVARVTSSRPLTVNGQIFAFVGAKGGVGTTTTAINVAVALAQVAPDEQTLLMDMHLSYGDAAVYLGAEPRFSVADAMENTHRLDEAFFESLVVQTKSGVHLLASAERATSGADLRRVSTLLQFAMSHYRFTLLDLPRSDASALDALEGVATILIVANQELATVRNAGRMAAALRQRYGKERVRVIVSRYDRQAEIGTEDVARVVGSPVSFNVPSDYRAALQALNKGRPLAVDRDTKLAAAFHAIACELAGVKAQPVGDDAKGGGLLGLFGRR
jgi:pilus assembly protein CpaE